MGPRRIARPLAVRRAVVATSVARNNRNNRTNNYTTANTTATTTSSTHATAVAPSTLNTANKMRTVQAASMSGSVKYSEIYNLAIAVKYSELLTKLDIRPDGAKYVDKSSGNMALHVCCSHLNVKNSNDYDNNKLLLEVIRKLLEHYSNAARAFNNDGELPLHICVTHNSNGDWQYEIIREVLEVFPYAANTNTLNTNKSAIAILYLNFLKSDFYANISDAKSKVTSIANADDLLLEDGNLLLIHMYKVATALILAAGVDRDNGNNDTMHMLSLKFDAKSFKFLKTVLSVALHLHNDAPIPPDLIDLTSRLFIQSVTAEREVRAIARKQREEEAAALGLDLDAVNVNNANHGTNNNSLSLLHQTIDAGIGWNWGARKVYESDETSGFAEIQTVGFTRLLPFGSAAVGVRTDLETVYLMLRAYPDGIAEYIPKNYILKAEKKKYEVSRSRSGPCNSCVIM